MVKLLRHALPLLGLTALSVSAGHALVAEELPMATTIGPAVVYDVPGGSGKVIGMLQKGSNVSIAGCSDDHWCEADGIGWVSSALLDRGTGTPGDMPPAPTDASVSGGGADDDGVEAADLNAPADLDAPATLDEPDEPATAVVVHAAVVRDKPDNAATVVGKLQEGEEVPVVRCGANWCEINTAGGLAYVAALALDRNAKATARTIDPELVQDSAALAEDLEPQATPLGGGSQDASGGKTMRATEAVNIRVSRDGIKVKSGQTLSAGAVVLVGSCEAGWCPISWQGISGWVAARYLAAADGSSSVATTAKSKAPVSKAPAKKSVAATKQAPKAKTFKAPEPKASLGDVLRLDKLLGKGALIELFVRKPGPTSSDPPP